MDLVVFENNKPWVIDEFRPMYFDFRGCTGGHDSLGFTP